MFDFLRCKRNIPDKTALPPFENRPIIVSKDIDINDLFNKKNKKTLKVKNDDEEINGWTQNKNKNLIKWKNDLEYQWIINIFILYDLKDNESFLTWLIILISTISSSLSVVQFGDESYKWIEIYLKAGLSISTILTTLIAAWLKKNNYVERINSLDKYLQKVIPLYFELENIYINDFKDRCEYEIYNIKHGKPIVEDINYSRETIEKYKRGGIGTHGLDDYVTDVELVQEDEIEEVTGVKPSES